MHWNKTYLSKWAVAVALAVSTLVAIHVMAGTGVAQDTTRPDDPLRRLGERIDALECENARLEGMLLQQRVEEPPVLEYAPANPNAPTYPYSGSEPESPGILDRIEKGLGTRYENGFILVDTPDAELVPFKLQLNVFNQFRFLNQNLDESFFTDHLGNTHPVDARNDINLNRNLYYFGGFAFDQKLIYNLIIWSSNSVATVIQGGYVGYQFDKSFTLYGGYWGIPGSRSNTRDFMWLQGVERSMADSFFRPGFTQGVWAEGQLFDHLNYVAYAGNSMNTLNVNTSKIDKNLVYATSWWWEPLGDYGPPGAPRMAFSDLEHHDCMAVRLGTSFTGSREDRFSNPAVNPENVAIYNSDGTLFFAEGSLAPGVTVLFADAYIWGTDFGLKYKGLALNTQYYLRWLNDFVSNGPLPLDETFDHGFEASLGYFLVPQTFELYGRTSSVFGEFRDSSEYAVGTNWHPWSNRGFRLITELNRVDHSPTASIQTIYNAGMNGWNFVLQTQFYF